MWYIYPPNDSISEKNPMEDLYKFFNQKETELLEMIVKRRQFKLKTENLIQQIKDK